MVNARHTSETPEWFTPVDVVEAARATLEGAIDLDPASCFDANKVVRAEYFYDATDNGFASPWRGRVFLNPPGGKCDADGLRVVRGRSEHTDMVVPCEESGACGLPPGHTHRGPTQSASKAWWFRLVEEYEAGRVTSAIFLGYSIEILQTTQIGARGLARACDFPLCVPSRRLAFTDSDGKQVKGNTHASVIVYLPPRHDDLAEHRFCDAFVSMGAVRL